MHHLKACATVVCIYTAVGSTALAQLGYRGFEQLQMSSRVPGKKEVLTSSCKQEIKLETESTRSSPDTEISQLVTTSFSYRRFWLDFRKWPVPVFYFMLGNERAWSL